MKSGKKAFVRFTNFEEQQKESAKETRQVRQPKKINKKSYTQKPIRNKQAIKQVLESFQEQKSISKNVANMLEKFPQFFTSEKRLPQKDSNENYNEALLLPKKPNEYKERKQKQVQMMSSSDPDWNSDDDVDDNIKSSAIKTQVVETIEKKVGDRPIKNKDILKRHERIFLEDHYKQKAEEERKKKQYTQKEGGKLKKEDEYEKKDTENTSQGSKDAKPANIWSQYQQKQVSNFMNMGYITKVDEEEDEIYPQLEENNPFLADEDFNNSSKGSNSGKSSDEEQDDIFGDEQSTTKKVQIQNKEKENSNANHQHGKVLINSKVFYKISEQVGIHPSACIWIVSNKTDKYRVSTQYMDEIYRKEKLFEMFPWISLNHSEFVHNDDVQKEKSLSIFKDFNYRKYQQKGKTYTNKKTYNQKYYSHNLKRK